VGDVSGHGIESALLMTTVRAFIRQRSSMEGSISSIVSDVNLELTGDVGESGSFITLFYTKIYKKEKSISWVRAGHDPAIIYNTTNDSFDELSGYGLPLGVNKDSEYKELHQTLNPGQIIVIGTDGIWETRNTRGESFEKQKLRHTIRANADRPAKEIVQEVIDEVDAFRSSIIQEDDVTLVIVKVE